MPDGDKDNREGTGKGKKPHVVAEHVVGGISKTGLEMFLIGCGFTLPFLTWANKYRLMSFPLQLHGNEAEAIIDWSSASVIIPPAPLPFGFIMRFKPLLGSLLKCVCVGCVCV